MAEDDQDIAARIERLFVIPSKSCAGFELEASVLRATGLEFPAAGVERFRPNVLLSGLEAHDEERLDAIGGGASSSPRVGLGVDFPRHTIRDMVRAQHHLVSHELNLPGLLATGGYSMGAFQALCRDPLGDGTHGAEPGRRGVEGASLCRGKDFRVSFAVVAYVRSLQLGPPRP